MRLNRSRFLIHALLSLDFLLWKSAQAETLGLNAPTDIVTIAPGERPARAFGADGLVNLPVRSAESGPIIITSNPQGQTIELGAKFTMSVVATGGGGSIAYQWRKNGTPIPGATTASLTLNSAGSSDGGRYDVSLTDGVSVVTSGPADVTVVPVAHLSNLSIRTHAGTGPETLIVGFVIGGANTFGTKPLLIRGAGPALVAFGITDAIADPAISLVNAAQIEIGRNDNWGGSNQVVSVCAQVGAFPFGDPASRDAAMVQSGLTANSYTVQLNGIGNSSGTALAEIYDATAAETFSVTMRRLINVSARANVGPGGDVLIAGFAIAGRRPKTVLIRAIGPTLESFRVPGALADPKLELYDGGAVKIQENDDWGGEPSLADAFRWVGAFSLDAASHDAALLATLPPGTYTAQVSAVGNATGVALVEIYEVP